MNARPFIRRGKLGRLLILVAALTAVTLSESPQAAAPAAVRTPDATQTEALLPIEQLNAWLRQQPGFPGGPSLRVDIEWPASHRRQNLAPCQQAEPFLPSGAKLWGRLNVGIRCIAGARWTSWQPAHIRIHGPAFVSRQPMAAGRVPQFQDFRIEEVEWSQHKAPPVALDTSLSTYQLQRALAAGQALRTDHLRSTPAIRTGELVAAIAEGNGFRISTDAIALSSASEGQSIRVRTTSGKVLTGQVEGKSVKIFR